MKHIIFRHPNTKNLLELKAKQLQQINLFDAMPNGMPVPVLLGLFHNYFRSMVSLNTMQLRINTESSWNFK